MELRNKDIANRLGIVSVKGEYDGFIVGKVKELIKEAEWEIEKDVVAKVREWCKKNLPITYFVNEKEEQMLCDFYEFLDTLDGGEKSDSKPEDSERDRIAKHFCHRNPCKGIDCANCSSPHIYESYYPEADYVSKELLQPLREESKKIRDDRQYLMDKCSLWETCWRELREWVEKEFYREHAVMVKMDELEGKTLAEKEQDACPLSETHDYDPETRTYTKKEKPKILSDLELKEITKNCPRGWPDCRKNKCPDYIESSKGCGMKGKEEQSKEVKKILQEHGSRLNALTLVVNTEILPIIRAITSEVKEKMNPHF